MSSNEAIEMNEFNSREIDDTADKKDLLTEKPKKKNAKSKMQQLKQEIEMV